MREYFKEDGLPCNSALINGIMREILEELTDNEIRDLCIMLLQAEDIKPTEIHELLHLLCRI